MKCGPAFAWLFLCHFLSPRSPLSVSVDVLCSLSLSLQVHFLLSSVLDRRNTAHTGLSSVDEIKDRLYSVLKVRR